MSGEKTKWSIWIVGNVTAFLGGGANNFGAFGRFCGLHVGVNRFGCMCTGCPGVDLPERVQFNEGVWVWERDGWHFGPWGLRSLGMRCTLTPVSDSSSLSWLDQLSRVVVP